MLARWIEELSQYDMIIQHCPGKQHGNADGLSQIPNDYCNCYEAGINISSLPCRGCKCCTKVHNQWVRFLEEVDNVIPLAVRTASLDISPEEILSSEFSIDEQSTWLPHYTSAELREAQQADPELKQKFSLLEDKVTPTVPDLYLSSPAVKHFWLAQSQLKIVDGVLRYQWVGENKNLLMVPQSLKLEILEGCHDCPTSGHLGQHKTLSRVQKSFLWHEMQQDVIEYVRTCPKCNKNKKPRVKPKAGLGCFRAGAHME